MSGNNHEDKNVVEAIFVLDKDTRVYHYCSVDTFVNILKTNSIWLTHAREMNDSFEDIYFEAPLKKALQAFEDKTEIEQKLLQKIVSAYSDRVDFPYVACFSRENDVLSQWRAYADDGRGVAIGFELGMLPHFDLTMQQHGEALTTPIMIDEVSYCREDDEIEFMRKILSACLINYRKSENEAMVFAQGVNALSKLSIFAKGKGFEEEQEVRLVFYPYYRDLLANLNCEQPQGCDGENIQFRVKDGRIVSYFPYSFPAEAIRSITLGPKCNIDFAQLTLFLNRYAPQIRINNEVHYSQIPYR